MGGRRIHSALQILNARPDRGYLFKKWATTLGVIIVVSLAMVSNFKVMADTAPPLALDGSASATLSLATQTASGGGAPDTITISTTNPNPMILGVMSNMGGQGLTAPTSFTDLYNRVVPWNSKDFAYRIVSSSQSNYGLIWGNGQGNAWLGL